MSFAFAFPNIDPVLIEFGPFVIRWYALAYIVGLLVGWRYMRVLAKGSPRPIALQDIDDFVVWATLGVIIGGRLGYVLFYNLQYYAGNPLAALEVWKGGMSFHGGLIGVIVATFIFVHRRKVQFLPFADLVACAAPIGLFLGRIANFINGELYGRISDVSWAIVFPRGGPEPRHPSQLYEAGLEGVVLFALLYLLWRINGIRQRPGTLAGVFFIGYGLARTMVELFREPDTHIGFLLGGTTTGQWLSVPMVVVGLSLIIWSKSRAEPTGRGPHVQRSSQG